MKVKIKKVSSRKDIYKIIRRLEKYGNSRHGNKSNPLDEAIYIILSKQTDGQRFSEAYKKLKGKCKVWKNILKMPIKNIANVIKSSGLENQKAGQIKNLIKKIYKDRGIVSLAWLKKLETPEALDYLMGLPGLGIKSAYCILMYSLSRGVLPVDINVFRISCRLGLIPQHISLAEAHHRLEKLIPLQKRYSYHVNCISLGRDCCRNQFPKCQRCVLQNFCNYGKRSLNNVSRSTFKSGN